MRAIVWSAKPRTVIFPSKPGPIAKIGDTLNPNMETIVALKPDIVFVSTASQIEAFTKTLEANGIAVYVRIRFRLKAFTRSKQLGELFGTQDIAEELVADLTARSGCGGQHESKWRKAGAMCLFRYQRSRFSRSGNNRFIAIIERRGRIRNERCRVAYPKLSKETASALNPEAIILSDSEDNKEPNDAFKNSPAVKNGRVYKINADILVTSRTEAGRCVGADREGPASGKVQIADSQ